MSDSFCKKGQRAEVFHDPYSMLQKEGEGQIVAVAEHSDRESAYVEIELDEGESVPPGHLLRVWRWILPKHIKQEANQ